MSARKQEKVRARAERLRREAQLRAQERRKRWLLAGGGSMAALALAVMAILVASGSSAHTATPSAPPAADVAPLAVLGKLRSPGPPGAPGPEEVPVPDAPDLATANPGAPSPSIDGIECLGGEQVAFHIHVHLTVFVDGMARRVPYGIGIRNGQVSNTPVGPYVGGGSCFYWLHTHSADGIIHIESPVVRTYTLGEFFDVWGQKLGRTQVGPATGTVTALFNDHVFRGNPRDIPLTAHAQIQLEVGRPLVAPVAISFPPGL